MDNNNKLVLSLLLDVYGVHRNADTFQRFFQVLSSKWIAIIALRLYSLSHLYHRNYDNET